MFGDLNEVSLIGNITNDLEVKSLPSGVGVLNFGLATNRRYKSGEEWKDETDFHNIVLFGNQAESIAKWAKKGTRVFVQGRLRTRTWEDKDGKKNYRTEIVASRVLLLDRYNKPAGKGGSKDESEDFDIPVPADDGSKVDPNDLPF